MTRRHDDRCLTLTCLYVKCLSQLRDRLREMCSLLDIVHGPDHKCQSCTFPMKRQKLQLQYLEYIQNYIYLHMNLYMKQTLFINAPYLYLLYQCSRKRRYNE